MRLFSIFCCPVTADSCLTVAEAKDAAAPAPGSLGFALLYFADTGNILHPLRTAITDFLVLHRTQVMEDLRLRRAIKELQPLTYNGVSWDQCVDALAASNLVTADAIKIVLGSAPKVCLDFFSRTFVLHMCILTRFSRFRQRPTPRCVPS